MSCDKSCHGAEEDIHGEERGVAPDGLGPGIEHTPPFTTLYRPQVGTHGNSRRLRSEQRGE